MDLSFNLISKYITKSFYYVGSACLLIGVTLFFLQPANAATGAPSKDHCDPGYVFSDEIPPDWEYSGAEIITEVQIKSGQGCFPLTISTPNDGCYEATGLGTAHVIVSKIGSDSPSCQDISHVFFYSDQVEPSSTPTNTTTSTPTQTGTPTLTNTATTTNTATNTATPTATSTLVAIDPVVTVTPTDTPPPTVTDTPVTPPPPAANPTDQAPEPTPTKPPTIPPPTLPPGTPTQQILIPVTGVDYSLTNQNSGSNFMFYIYLGIWLLGIGMVFRGAANHLTQNETK